MGVVNLLASEPGSLEAGKLGGWEDYFLTQLYTKSKLPADK